MPLCIAIDGQGKLEAVIPSPPDYTLCSFVAITPQEFVSLTTEGPFNLTPEQGSQIGGAILLIWAAAWVVRALSRTINASSSEKET